MSQTDNSNSIGRLKQVEETWAWAHEQPETPPIPSVDPSLVTAVMVVSNGQEWLIKQLAALARLKVRPGTLLVVDNKSTDNSMKILEKGRDEGLIDEIIVGNEIQGFGASIEQALEGKEIPEWLWLLHDDLEPKSNSLKRMLEAAAVEKADVVVPKLLQPKRRNYPDQLQEIGQSISKMGRRVISVEPGDIDQEQIDSERVLGASTAGLLVRGQVWHEIGGFDLTISLYRDGLEFCWRANLYGFKVITCPSAALYHQQAGRSGIRNSVISKNSDVLDRLYAMRLVAAYSAKPKRTSKRLFINSIARSFGLLMGKSPRAALGELVALHKFNKSKDITMSLHRRFSKLPTDNQSEVKKLLPARGSGIKHFFDRCAAAFVDRYRYLMTEDASGSTSIDDLTGDDFAGYGKTHSAVSPVMLMSIILLAFGIFAGRHFLGTESIFGGGLLPAPGSFTNAWDAYLNAQSSHSPWLLLTALGTTLMFGHPSWLILAIVLIAPLWAGLSMVSLLRRLFNSQLAWSLVGGIWGSMVALLGIIGDGSISGLVAAIALPSITKTIVIWTFRPTDSAERWRAPAVFAWWVIVLTAVMPVVWIIVAVCLLTWGIVQRVRLPEIFGTLFASGIFFIWWLPSLWKYPARIFTGPDPLASPDIVPNAFSILLGRYHSHPPLLAISISFFGIFWLCYLCAMVYAKISLKIRFLSLAALILGVVATFVLGHQIVFVSGGAARPDVTFWIVVALFGSTVPIGYLVQNKFDENGAKLALVSIQRVLACLLVFISLIGIGQISYTGTAGLNKSHRSLLPSYVKDVQLPPRAGRALMFDINLNEVKWALISDSQPQWGTAERDPVSASPKMAKKIDAVAAAIGQGKVGDQLGRQLAQLAISHIWIKGASSELLAAMSNSSDLSRTQESTDVSIFTVAIPASVARIETAAQSVPVTSGSISASGENRKLVIAESPEGRWQAKLNGKELKSIPDKDEPEFELPHEGGKLEWHPSWNKGLLTGQIIILTLLAIFAAPVVRPSSQARRARKK